MVATLSIIILVGFIAYFSYLQSQIAKHSKNKNEKGYVLVLLVLYLVANLYFLVIFDMRFPVDLFLFVGYSCMIGFFWGFHIVYKRILKMEGKEMKDIDMHFQESKGSLHEFLRKFFHFFVFGGSLLFIIIYYYACLDIMQQDPNFGAHVRSPWEDTIFAGLSVDVMYDLDIRWPYQLETAMIIFFMIALPFAIIAEYFRLNPRLGVPFQLLFVKSLRPHEQHNAADYYFFTFGIFLSAVFLPVAAVFGTLCLMCFGDTFASLVGKRIDKEKKHPIRWENEKCWEGSIAGFIFTFITSIFFVGWFVATILGIIFLLIDIVTPNRIKISDNFLYPIISVLVLFIIFTLGFAMDGPIANIFNEMNQLFYENVPDLIWD